MRLPICFCLVACGSILTQTGCPKSSALPKELRDFGKASTPIAGGPVVSPLPPPQPLSADLAVLPPKCDPQGKVPALPGSLSSTRAEMPIPVAATQPISTEDPEASEEEKRLLERLRERREQRLKEKEKSKEKPNELPPAVEKEKDIAPPPVKKPDAPPPPPPTPPEAPPMPPTGKIPAPKPAPVNSFDIRGFVQATAKRYESIPDYEARLIKREVVKGKQMPGEEMLFRYRKEPHSVYMFVTSDNGKGRELLYVKGQNNGKMTIITGKGDNALVGVGAKFNFDPDDPMATSKTRNRVGNAGYGRTFTMLNKFFDDDASGKRPSGTIRVMGDIERPEFAKPVMGLEVIMIPGDDPNLPKGGKRQYYFDRDEKSPSYGFPVLFITYENEKEVEYYCFDRFKMPANFTDADFSPEKLGGKKK